MNIDIKISDEREWKKLEGNPQHGTIFHTWEWLKIVEKHVNMRLYPIIGMRGSNIIGIYPLFLHRNFILRAVFSPPPWVAVPYLGPVILEYEKLKQDKRESVFIAFQRKVDEFIREEMKAHYSFIKTAPGILDARPLKWNGYIVEPIYNYVIDLRKGADSVFKNFKKKLRQNIKRAKRRGISVEEGSREELEWIYETIVTRYEEQNRKISLSKGYLIDLFNTFHPHNMKIFVAKYNGELIGGMIDFYYKNKVTSWLGNVKSNVGGMSPNELLQWEAIKHAIKCGMEYYEEIGANTERLCHYKSKYNPSLSICFSAKKNTSVVPKMMETVYLKILRPMRKSVGINKIFKRR